MNTRSLQIADNTLTFDQAGSGSPVLLLHGAFQTRRLWRNVGAALAQRHTVIAPDLRGHGDSAWAPDGNYEMNAFVYDFAQLVHTLGHDQVTIVSHSLGGNIATRFTGLYPEKVRKLVNIEGLGPSPARLAERELGGGFRARQGRGDGALDNAAGRHPPGRPDGQKNGRCRPGRQSMAAAVVDRIIGG